MDIYTSLAPGRQMGVGIVAAGTTQATAFVLTNAVNEITTAATGSGVSLPTSLLLPGSDAVVVLNRGANALLVYPPMVPQSALNGSAQGAPAPSGMNIENAAANASVSIAAGATATFRSTSATQIRQN